MHIFLTNVSLVHIHCDITHLSVSRVPTTAKPFTRFGKLWRCPDCTLLLILPTESDDPDGIKSIPGSVSCRRFSFSDLETMAVSGGKEVGMVGMAIADIEGLSVEEEGVIVVWA